jgi:hypothetical protein
MPEVPKGECDSIGIMGGCGFECPVWLRGDCLIPDAGLEWATPEEFVLYHEIYGEPT